MVEPNNVYMTVGSRVCFRGINIADPYLVTKGPALQDIKLYVVGDGRGPIEYNKDGEWVYTCKDGLPLSMLFADQETGEQTWVSVHIVPPHNHPILTEGGPAVGTYDLFKI